MTKRDIQRESMNIEGATSTVQENRKLMLIPERFMRDMQAHEGTTNMRLTTGGGWTARQCRRKASLTERDIDMEVRRHRRSRIPHAPAREETMSHLPWYLPLRSCCPICAKADGAHDHHRTHASESSELMGTMISFDGRFPCMWRHTQSVPIGRALR